MNSRENNVTHGFAQLANGLLTAPEEVSYERRSPTLQNAVETGGAVFISRQDIINRIYRAMQAPVLTPDCHHTHTERFAFGPSADGEAQNVQIMSGKVSQEVADAIIEVLAGTSDHADVRARLGMRTPAEAVAARDALEVPPFSHVDYDPFSPGAAVYDVPQTPEAYPFSMDVAAPAGAPAAYAVEAQV